MKELTLHGIWQIESKEGDLKMETTVPGTVMSALEERGEFGSEGIHYGRNNRNALDYADRDYLFSRTFRVNEEFLKDRRTFLEAEGLDTLAEIRIDGELIGETENMHRSYRFDLSFLEPGEHRIQILFKNTLSYVKKKQKDRFLMTSYEYSPELAHSGFNQIRKSHCSYGWDWGPIVPDVGIWRPIKLVSYALARLDHVTVRQNHSKNKVELNLHGRLDSWSEETLRWEVEVKTPQGEILKAQAPLEESLRLEIHNPQLWWPNGLGEQPLYTLDIGLFHGDKKLQSVRKTIGLRTMDVNREPDQWGPSFNFRCNGQDFFAMGADYIPEDLFLTRVTPERTRKLLEQAKAANFNSIRVWGGGVYPDENFFQCCDEMGLVVWQDFMFACAIYDVRNPQFRENIRLEALENAERIHHHASLGLLCGNNEMEMALVDWPDFIPFADQGVKEEYLDQYENLLKEVSQKAAPDTFYWPASPSSGGGFEDPNAPEQGDCHYWNVWHGFAPYEEYEEHYFRFMSEFGFESFPAWETVQSYAPSEEHYLTSPIIGDHQRCKDGNQKLSFYLDKYYRRPKDFESLVYLSQVSQAEAIRHGIEHWRRHRGRCMGAVYWQFNDNWPVISWSSIDYYGRWKALHYQAKRNFQPLLLSCSKEDQRLNIYLSNESRQEHRGEVHWQICRLNGEELLSGKSDAQAGTFTSALVATLDTGETLKNLPPSQWIVALQYKEQGKVIESRVEHFLPFKEMILEKPEIEWELKKVEGQMALDVRSSLPAFFVELQVEGEEILFSDNYFQLKGGENKRVLIESENSDLNRIREKLKIRSLYDSFE